MVGRNTALQATKGGGGAPGRQPVLTATLGPRTTAMDAEVESIFAALAEMFDEPSPAQPALLHEEFFGTAAKQTATRPRVTRPPAKVVPRVALPKAHDDDPDLDQSQTVRIERPVIPAEALRSNPPATPPPQGPLSAQAGTSKGHPPALPQPVTPAGSSAKGEPHACSPEDVTLISARPPVTKLEADPKLTPRVVVVAPADAAPKAAPAAQPLPASSPSRATVTQAPIRRPRPRAWITVASAMSVMVLGFAGWRGALALNRAASLAAPPESVPELTPAPESAPAEPTVLIADPAPVAPPAPAEPIAPPPQRAPQVAATLVHGQVHRGAPSGAPAWAARMPPSAPTAEPAPSVTPKAASRVSGPLIPLEEDPR